MAENSKIEWTHHTFNPWRGCTKVSPGCKNCYAETLSGRNPKTLGVWGPGGTRVVAAESAWREPLKWDRQAKVAGERHRVFCASLADVFEDWRGAMTASNGNPLWWCHGSMSNSPAPKGGLPDGCRLATVDDVRLRLFGLIDDTPNLDWLILTKRPENVLRMTYDAWCKKVPGHVSQNEGDGRRWAFPPNVWLGTSVEDQQRADERVPELLKVPAAVRFLSCEPLLEAVDLSRWLYSEDDRAKMDRQYLPGGSTAKVDWVIVGGESGPGARGFNPSWAKDVVNQCRAAGVACFVKQMGSNVLSFAGPLRDRKGGDMADWPAELRVREFPEVTR